MAQDREKALDEKTRKLSAGRIEDGKEHAAYQETQQQLLAIQAEQQQNLAVARAESKASFENNQTLAQAAELGAVSVAEAEQAAAAGAQAGAQLNPATQQILSKYGAGQPKFQRSQSHSQQVTKQNITINNNITSNTTNDVKVPANIGGPLQGRPVQFKDPSTAGGGSVGKFKTWISAAFARQNEEGARRDREYRSRESSLTKSANKMMKKLEDIGKTIGTRMDPRKIGSTWQSQLKTLLFLFGFGYLTSNWTKILTQIASIEKWFKEDFAGFFGIGKKDGEESGLKKMIRGLLGGKEGEGVFEMLGKLLFKGDESLLGYMKLWLKNAMEERAKAVKLVKFPQLDMDDVIGSIGKIGEYLGDVISALVSGAEGAKRHINTQIGLAANRGALQYMQNDDKTRSTTKVTANIDGRTQTVSADKGIEALFKDKETGKREHRGLTRYSLDSNGELTGSTESTYAQSVHLQSAYVDAIRGEKAFNTADVARGIERLYNAAKKKKEAEGHGIPIAEGFLDTLSKDLVDKLTREGKLKKVPYHRVVRKKTDEDYAIEDADPTAMATKAFANKAILDSVGLGEASDTLAKVEGAAAGAAGGAAGGAMVGGVGAAPGAAMGAGLGWLMGGAMNSKWARGAKALAKGAWNYATANDYRIEYERGKGGKDDTVYFQEITPEGIQEIANFLTNGMTYDTKQQANINIADKGFTDNIRNSFEVAANNNIKNLKKDLRNAQSRVLKTRSWEDIQAVKTKENQIYKAEQAKQGVDDSDLQELYKGIEELSAIESEHRAQEDEAWGNTRFMKGVEYASDGVYNLSGGRFGTKTENLSAKKSVDSKELKRRKLYLLKILKGKGLNGGAAAGIIGNLEGEGLGRDTSESARVSDPTKKDKSAYSMGIAMFNSKGELPNLKSWAKQKGLNHNTFETQAQYISEHPVTQKILKETKSLSPQDSLKKSAIIWGHDFERFLGYDAADSHGNLIGRGKFIKVKENKKDKYRSDGKFHGDENYAERIQKGLNTYSTYEGSDLSNIKLQSSSGFEQPDESGNNENYGGSSGTGGDTGNGGEKKEARSFLDILKDQVTSLITSFGGIAGTANDAISPIVNGVKEKIFANGYAYTGPITKEFTDYETYKANQDKLPKDLPAGLDYADWKNRVFDMTGSMPQNLDLSAAEASRQKEELRKDSKDILEKFTKPEATKTAGDELDDLTYIKLLNDPAYANLSPEEKVKLIESGEISKVTAAKTHGDELDDETYLKLLNDPKYANLSTEEKIKKIESGEITAEPLTAEMPEKESSNPFLNMFDPKNFEKKEDKITTIVDYLTETNAMLGKILGVESANGMTSAHIVDAVNQGTMASANASMNMARSISAQQKNQTSNMPSLQGSKNKSLTGVA